jgi:hypothetical protein
MITLDREFQRRILEELREAYPNKLNFSARGFNSEVSIGNVAYLEEHGLIVVVWSRGVNENRPVEGRITAKGVDFLADDGGLSAILGVVTVKTHEDSVKAILIDHVEKSAEPDDVKSKLINQIKNLPGEGVKVATTEGLKAGFSHMPDVIGWLQTLLDL